MPVSIWEGMEDTLTAIVDTAPQSVLDAGIGFGLWGCLLRQYLDVWSGRILPPQWRTRIDGVEIDQARVQAHARYLYDEVLIGDIRDVVPLRAAEVPYDVILFGDVIEHLPKDDGFRLLDVAAGLARRLVVARIPLGDGWRREGREEPDHHRSQWLAADLTDRSFAGHAAHVRVHHYAGNPYGLVTIPGAEPGGSTPSVEADLLTDLEQRASRLVERVSRMVAS